MLNQTNIAQNNNKFYLGQVLESDRQPVTYAAWFRWGRVGYSGQTKLERCGNLAQAISSFTSKFKAKTDNSWGDREQFVKHPGKYFMLERDYGVQDDEEEGGENAAVKQERKTPESKLQPKIQLLMRTIFNKDMMNLQMAEIGYDVKKMPLGKLTKEHIRKGYNVLTQISDELNAPSPNRANVMNLSSLFYTIIPHSFGFMVPPPINTPALLKAKMQMIESLDEIQIAAKVLKDSEGIHDVNPIDVQYDSLKCNIQHMDPSDEMYSLISEYLKTTHAPTHSGYKLNIQEVYRLHKPEERANFAQVGEKIGNLQLLWHGSRLTNYVGILSHGLKIAPPEAPSTGYMFGKGIYFADMVSKSANYCFASSNSTTAFILLCCVALGTPQCLDYADYNAERPIKKEGSTVHSTKGVGKTMPNPSRFKTIENGKVTVPVGEPTNSGKGRSLLYNEYIVYDVRQVQMEYLIQVQFVF